jgi:peptide/nickel transport system permease protein
MNRIANALRRARALLFANRFAFALSRTRKALAGLLTSALRRTRALLFANRLAKALGRALFANRFVMVARRACAKLLVVVFGVQRIERWRQMRKVFFSNRLAVASVFLLVFIVVACFFGDLVYHTDQLRGAAATNCVGPTWHYGICTDLPPSKGHPLGTDGNGFDILGRILFAGRTDLQLGALAGLVTVVVGTLYGMVSGFLGGRVDSVMMRFLDGFLSIPGLFFFIMLRGVFGGSNTVLVLVIGLTGWWGNARIIRSDAVLLRERDYTKASASMGAVRRHMLARHVLPNSMGNIITTGTFSVADAILGLAGLSFIGLGVQSPTTDWGNMMSIAGTPALQNGYWWEIFPACVILILVILCINYIGDALRDVFEVRLRDR